MGDAALPPAPPPPPFGAASPPPSPPRTLASARLPSDPNLAARVAAVPPAAVAEVRARLAACDDAAVAAFLAGADDGDVDEMVNQFLRAAAHCTATAAARLADTLKWRASDDGPAGRPCPACAVNPRSHHMFIAGRDDAKRPVFYSCLALARDRACLAANVRHMTMIFEQAISCMRAEAAAGGPVAQQWVWVSDFHGFGVADLNPAIGRAFLNLCATHYPERLARFVLVGAPPLFNSLWALLKRYICAETRAKILFLPYEAGDGGATARGLRGAGIGGDTAAWLVREMAQNRCAATLRATGKHYPYRPADRAAAVVIDGHDVRGTADIVSLVATAPGCGLPFGDDDDAGQRAAEA